MLWGALSARLHALLQEVPLHRVARQCQRPPEVLARGLAPAAPQLELALRRVVERIGREAIAARDRADRFEPALGALVLRDGDGAVECDYGGGTDGH